MSMDKIVGLIGLFMALVIVLFSGGLRRMPRQRMLMMAGVWLVIIAVAALAFANFRG